MKSPAVVSLEAELEAVCATMTRELVAASLGRLGTAPSPGVVLPFARPRKKAPIQLCPAPGCAKRAAPVFGMLCGSHKDAPRSTVKAWRAARRARKATR